MVFQRMNPVHLLLMFVAAPVLIPVAIGLLPLVFFCAVIRRPTEG